MSISPLGPRQFQNTALTGSGQPGAKSGAATQGTSAASKLSSNVALSPGSVDLQQRVDALGNDTIDLAQHFLGSFAQKLFGDDAKGATIAFDSVSLEASSSMGAGVMRSAGAESVTSMAGFSLDESSHFLGKGTITMADGSKYDFEVEVQYEASMTAGAAQTEREKLIEQNPAMPLPAIEFPDVDWPGSLGDLFKLMDKQISGNVQDDATGDLLGSLTMRLQKLVNSTQSLDTYGPPEVKSGAQAYAAESVKQPPEVADEAPVRAGPGQTPDTPVRTASDIPLTISTTPPPVDEA